MKINRYKKRRSGEGLKMAGCKAKDKSLGAATDCARVLFRQIERENSQCAFWVVSAINKMKHDGATITCVMNVLKQEMPTAYKEYMEYLRTT
jgi:hypothetical protein